MARPAKPSRPFLPARSRIRGCLLTVRGCCSRATAISGSTTSRRGAPTASPRTAAARWAHGIPPARARSSFVPIPDLAFRVTVSVNGGVEPHWAPNGEVFYRNSAGDRKFSVTVRTTPTLRLENPSYGSKAAMTWLHGFTAPSVRCDRRRSAASDGYLRGQRAGTVPPASSSCRTGLAS